MESEDNAQSDNGQEQEALRAADVPMAAAAGESSDDEEISFKSCSNEAPCPPELSDEDDNHSVDSVLEYDDDADSDVSDPGRQRAEEDENDGEETMQQEATSFQQELLDYLGSLFNAGSRLRSRTGGGGAAAEEMTQEHLREYSDWRERVRSELRVVGVGKCERERSRIDNVAKAMPGLLAARERGDWAGCRRGHVPGWAYSNTDDSVIEEPLQRPSAGMRETVCASRWAATRLALEARISKHEGCVNALNWSASGQWLASGSDDRKINITDWVSRATIARFAVGHVGNIFQVRFLPASRDLELVTCSRDSSVRYTALSPTGGMQYFRVLARHKDACHTMDIPLDNPRLVLSAGEDARVLLSDVREQIRASSGGNRLCPNNKVPLYSISCSPVRSQEFCVGGKDNHVLLFDRRQSSVPLQSLCPPCLGTGDRRERTSDNYHVTAVTYSREGNSVLASYNDDDIYLLSTVAAGQDAVLQVYRGHRNVQTITGVGWWGGEREQRFVVSGSNDGHVLLWEKESGALVQWLRADEAGVVNVLEPHPHEPLLATAGLDYDVKLWSMRPPCSEPGDKCQQRGVRLEPGINSLLQRCPESARIDMAWNRLDKELCQAHDQSPSLLQQPGDLPFDLRDLQAITAVNWKMRAESYPYTFDTPLENLFLMTRRRGASILDDEEESDDEDEGEANAPSTAAAVTEPRIRPGDSSDGEDLGDNRSSASRQPEACRQS